jgi:hypothetical protein
LTSVIFMAVVGGLTVKSSGALQNSVQLELVVAVQGQSRRRLNGEAMIAPVQHFLVDGGAEERFVVEQWQ